MPGTGNSISVRTAGARDAALLASLGRISQALYAVGGQYRRSM